MSTYHMPAEWSRHQACIVLYPHNALNLDLDPSRQEFHAVIDAIVAGNERVLVYCLNAEQKEALAASYRDQFMVQVAVCPSNDTWARDTAPTFVTDGQRLIGVDWEFNAYGGEEQGCYWPCDKDCRIAQTICSTLGVEARKVPLVLEGGSIHTDGEGTILTTEECLLHSNRNPHLTKAQIEELVLHATGCSKMIWLPTGLAFDEDTNGHIDNFACFVAPATVVLAWTDDQKQDIDNYQRCRRALEVLEASSDAKGRRIQVIKLYLPSPVVYTADDIARLGSDDKGNKAREAGERMAASYVNFYIANESVVVPQFGDKVADQRALSTLQPLFPTRKVIGVSSRNILMGGGNIHCITQQYPL